MMKKKIALALVTMLPVFVMGHPGHGHDYSPLSPGHYIGNPQHAIPLTLVIAVGVVLVQWGVAAFIKRLRRENIKK